MTLATNCRLINGFRSLLFFLVLVVLADTGCSYALGSLTSAGSVLKKTLYSCVIRSFVDDRAGRLWVGTFGAGLLRFDEPSHALIATGSNGLPDPRISKLLLDDDGSLLVATAGGGAARYSPENGRWSSLIPGSEPGSKHFHAFAKTASGCYLLGAVGEGVFVSRGKGWANTTESDGLPSSWVNDALVESDGSVWLATWDGIAHMNASGAVDRVELPESGWSDGNVNVIASFAGSLWIGTASGGLVRRNAPGEPGKRPRYEKIPGLPMQVHALTVFDGKLWIATENGLFSLDAGAGAKPAAELLDGDSAVTALGAWKSRLVAGTDLGVIWMRGAEQTWKKIYHYSKEKPSAGGLAR